MGISEENWPATVGLFTGIFAKEAVVGTLNSLYGQLGTEEQAQGDTSTNQDEVFDLLSSLTDAAATIPANLLDLTAGLIDPLGLDIGDISNHTVAAEEQEVDVPTFGAMVTRFNGQLGAFAYLLMILLYTPCVAAIGAISREIGGRWALFAVVWTTSLAYGSAVLVYQLGTFEHHQTSSSIWIASILGLLAVAITSLYRFGRHSRSSQIPVQEMPL
jgi:ferrous iron transport protein B